MISYVGKLPLPQNSRICHRSCVNRYLSVWWKSNDQAKIARTTHSNLQTCKPEIKRLFLFEESLLRSWDCFVEMNAETCYKYRSRLENLNISWLRLVNYFPHRLIPSRCFTTPFPLPSLAKYPVGLTVYIHCCFLVRHVIFGTERDLLQFWRW